MKCRCHLGRSLVFKMHGRFTDKFRLEASEYHDAHLDGIFAKDATLKDFLVGLSVPLMVIG